jgi:hypothetical protein
VWPVSAKKRHLGEGRPAEAFARRYELGRLFAAISLGLRRALQLKLRIANSFGQHLAQLSLGSWRFALEGFCPCGHGQYMGMQEGELNPWALSGGWISMANYREFSFGPNCAFRFNFQRAVQRGQASYIIAIMAPSDFAQL